jgi:hypothetical protein
MSLRPVLLWLEVILVLIIQCLSRSNYIEFYMPPKITGAEDEEQCLFLRIAFIVRVETRSRNSNADRQ